MTPGLGLFPVVDLDLVGSFIFVHSEDCCVSCRCWTCTDLRVVANLSISRVVGQLILIGLISGFLLLRNSLAFHRRQTSGARVQFCFSSCRVVVGVVGGFRCFLWVGPLCIIVVGVGPSLPSTPMFYVQYTQSGSRVGFRVFVGVLLLFLLLNNNVIHF